MKISTRIHRKLHLVCLASLTTLLGACATMDTSGPRADATLEARSGSKVSGTVSFKAAGQKIRVEARVAGLTPGPHGFHVHEAGDCSAADASSAKGHFNPAEPSAWPSRQGRAACR
jgi:Cu-Zn family superoxide dismutase